MKKCTKCKIEKPLIEFSKNSYSPDGIRCSCKLCAKIVRHNWYIKNREKGKLKSQEWRRLNPEKVKEASKRNHSKNKERNKIKLREWCDRNREKVRKRCREWSKTNRDKVLPRIIQWRKNNPDKVRQYTKNWASNNRDKVCASTMRRNARKLKATPKWANNFFIGEIYHICMLRNKITGIKWHVDHIIPLNNKLVCGLHVETNLQVILATVNIKKGNKYVSNT